MSSIVYKVLFVLIYSLLPSLGADLELPPADTDAMLLSQTRTLNFFADAPTNHRREPAIAQLTCTGPGCALYQVKEVRCTNLGASSGADKEDIEWACSATVPAGFKLGSTDVSCEGFRNRNDPYILRESCGVTFGLLLTDVVEGEPEKEEIEQERKVRSALLRAIRKLGVLFLVYLAASWVWKHFAREPPEQIEGEGRKEGRWRTSNSHGYGYLTKRARDGTGGVAKTPSSSSKSSTSTGFGSTVRR